jgi:hypothetical protein
MAFSIFREIRLSLPVGCDNRDYRNFIRSNDNRYFTIIANFFAYAIIAKIVVLAINSISYQIDREMERETERERERDKGREERERQREREER